MQTEIYRNLNNGKWSIKQDGQVVGHATAVTLVNVTQKHSEATRQRILRTGHREVGTKALGSLTRVEGFTPFKGRTYQLQGFTSHNCALYRVTYNPQTDSNGLHYMDGEVFTRATVAEFSDKMRASR